MTSHTTAPTVVLEFRLLTQNLDAELDLFESAKVLFKPFTLGVWLVSILVIPVCNSIILTYLSRHRQSSHQGDPHPSEHTGQKMARFLRILSHSFIELFAGEVSSGGWGLVTPLPKDAIVGPAARVIKIAWGFFILIFGVCFTANLAAQLQSTAQGSGFSSMSDCLASPHCKFCEHAILKDLVQRRFGDISGVRAPNSKTSTAGVVEDVFTGTCNAALVHDVGTRMQGRKPQYRSAACRHKFVGDVIYKMPVIQPVNIKYQAAVSHWVRVLEEEGEFESLHNTWLPHIKCDDIGSSSSEAIGLANLSLPLALVVLAAVVALLLDGFLPDSCTQPAPAIRTEIEVKLDEALGTFQRAIAQPTDAGAHELQRKESGQDSLANVPWDVTQRSLAADGGVGVDIGSVRNEGDGSASGWWNLMNLLGRTGGVCGARGVTARHTEGETAPGDQSTPQATNTSTPTNLNG